MNDSSNTKSKLSGIAFTICFHVVLFFICAGSGLKYLYPPPEEQSILIEFEAEQIPEPIEVATGIEPRAPIPNPEKEVELVQHSEAQHIGKKLNEAQESTVSTDGDVEVKEPPRKKEIDKRALFSVADNNKKDTLAPQTSDRVSDALEAGHSQGNTRTGATDGEPSAKLAGRTLIGSLAIPSYTVQKSGRVVVRITVDRNGKVTSAIPGYQGTTVTDKTLWASAKEAALKATFNISKQAPASQEGTITYIFTLK